ncbi:unnamed protein product [Cylindrotheca closterium]|uniref:Ricin B lectin domain-containing protein n=1 Tax=Cylindrotheca closterium TaxID=2856 RepID=A0AAD2JIP5_9STRA|nr:unnamed protein product [Cylindrotheca closterium]
MKSIALSILLCDVLATAKLGSSLVNNNRRRKTQQLGTLREYGSNPQHTLGHCEGDCDSDQDCNGDELVCFQRDAHEPVPGCLGGLQDGSLSDYCVRKSDLNSGSTLEDLTLKYTTEFPLSRCEGDCDTNDDCIGDLICFQRNEHEAVPGCIGGENDGSRTDYCIPPSSLPPAELAIQWSTIFPLARCQGDCDSDFDCQGNLVCFQRNENEPVPGCSGGSADGSRTDYCVPPTVARQGQISPPSTSITSDANQISWSTNFPLGKCEGDCDYNHDCQDGLICWQRSHGESIPGCSGSDNSSTDYCIPKESAPAKKLKLYWDNYYWQESNDETFWCMTCTACDSLTTGDGWEGGCVVPENDKCEEGHLMWIQRCRETRKRFEIIENPNSGDQIRVHGSNLCFSSINNRFLELRTCDNTKSNQLWAAMSNRNKFEIRPYDQRNLSVNEAKCLSQLHHPKRECKSFQ